MSLDKDASEHKRTLRQHKLIEHHIDQYFINTFLSKPKTFQRKQGRPPDVTQWSLCTALGLNLGQKLSRSSYQI